MNGSPGRLILTRNRGSDRRPYNIPPVKEGRLTARHSAGYFTGKHNTGGIYFQVSGHSAGEDSAGADDPGKGCT
ncbi:hypothetical protein GCM10009414_31610 [Tatumella terrea]